LYKSASPPKRKGGFVPLRRAALPLARHRAFAPYRLAVALWRKAAYVHDRFSSKAVKRLLTKPPTRLIASQGSRFAPMRHRLTLDISAKAFM
jgi:hypothetical protein